MDYNDEIKKLEILLNDTADAELKTSIEKRIEVLKERKTVFK